jgi:AmmeMemoRadiSam system protein B
MEDARGGARPGTTTMTTTLVRPAAVAGSFYPDDAAVLAAVVEDFLAEAAEGAPAAAPKAVIAPHAGYVYSGPVAARAYARLRPAGAQSRIRRVVLVGPSHYVAFSGLALPRADAFETPLGRVPVDREAAERALALSGVCLSDAAHADEHALEVQLPFLQRVLGDFRIVPLVAGRARPEAVAAVLDALWGGDETLVVISSDLSHYHDQATARRLDAATAAAIEAGEAARIGPEDACGCVGITGLLAAAPRHDLAIERLALATSADTSGPWHSVVGYGAWAFGAARV